MAPADGHVASASVRAGDVVSAGFWRYDDTPDGAPSVRIWGHWNDSLPADPDGYDGSAGDGCSSNSSRSDALR